MIAERDRLDRAVTALQAHRDVLGDAAIAALHAQAAGREDLARLRPAEQDRTR